MRVVLDCSYRAADNPDGVGVDALFHPRPADVLTILHPENVNRYFRFALLAPVGRLLIMDARTCVHGDEVQGVPIVPGDAPEWARTALARRLPLVYGSFNLAPEGLILRICQAAPGMAIRNANARTFLRCFDAWSMLTRHFGEVQDERAEVEEQRRAAWWAERNHIVED